MLNNLVLRNDKQLPKLHTLSFGPITDSPMTMIQETDVNDENQTPFLPIKTMVTQTLTEKMRNSGGNSTSSEAKFQSSASRKNKGFSNTLRNAEPRSTHHMHIRNVISDRYIDVVRAHLKASTASGMPKYRMMQQMMAGKKNSTALRRSLRQKAENEDTTKTLYEESNLRYIWANQTPEEIEIFGNQNSSSSTIEKLTAFEARRGRISYYQRVLVDDLFFNSGRNSLTFKTQQQRPSLPDQSVPNGDTQGKPQRRSDLLLLDTNHLNLISPEKKGGELVDHSNDQLAPQILKKLISSRKLLNNGTQTKKDNEEIKDCCQGVLQKQLIPTKEQKMKRIQDLLLPSDSPIKENAPYTVQREMKAALKFLRKLGQSIRNAQFSPIAQENQEPNSDFSLAVEKIENYSPDPSMPQPSFPSVSLEKANSAESQFGSSGQFLGISPTNHSLARATSMDRKSIYNEVGSLSQIMNADSPINLDDVEQQYLELTKEYRNYDEIRFKEHRRKYNLEDGNNDQSRRRSLKVVTRQGRVVSPAIAGNKRDQMETKSMNANHGGGAAGGGFKIHLEQTEIPSMGGRINDEPWKMQTSLLRPEIMFENAERSISPIEKISNNVDDTSPAHEMLQIKNQKCQTSRNNKNTNQFSLHLFETSQDITSDKDPGGKFVSSESLYISEEGGGGNSSSQVSFLAKFYQQQEQKQQQQQQQTQFQNHGNLLEPQILKNGTKSVYNLQQQYITGTNQQQIDEIKKRVNISSAKSTYTRYSAGLSNREFSEKDFKSGTSGLKKLKNSLQELSKAIEIEEPYASAGRLLKAQSAGGYTSQEQLPPLPPQTKSEVKQRIYKTKELGFIGTAIMNQQQHSVQNCYGLEPTSLSGKPPLSKQKSPANVSTNSNINKGTLKNIQKNLSSLLADITTNQKPVSQEVITEYYKGSQTTMNQQIKQQTVQQQERFKYRPSSGYGSKYLMMAAKNNQGGQPKNLTNAFSFNMQPADQQ